MGIRLFWDSTNQRCDWMLSSTGIETGFDLESAILQRIFTDRRADSSWVDPAGNNDRRGSWMDSYRSQPMGSQLWQLWLMPITSSTTTESRAESMIATALQPLIDSGIVSKFNITAQLINSSSLKIAIDAYEPMTNKKSSYGYVWNNVNRGMN